MSATTVSVRAWPRARADERTVALAAAGLLTLAAAVLVLTTTTTGDYTHAVVAGRPAGDNAAPALAALLHGDLAGFVRTQPALGLTSLLLRLPFAGLARLAGGGTLGEYVLGALPCLVVVVAVGVAVARGIRRRGGAPVVALAVPLFALVNPLTVAAMGIGHPEELLTGALCAGAVLAAGRGRTTLAAVALGLAVGTKPWALVAAPAVAVALAPAAWWRAGIIAAAVAALLVLPAPLASPTAYHASTTTLLEGHMVFPQTAWWPVAAHRTAILPSGAHVGYPIMPLGLTRDAAMAALALLACGLGALAIRRRRGSPSAALRLLAAVMLARVVLDPYAIDYYAVPLIIALAALATEEPLAGLVALLPPFGVRLAFGAHAAGLGFALTLAWVLPVALFLARPPRADRRPSPGPALSRAA